MENEASMKNCRSWKKGMHNEGGRMPKKEAMLELEKQKEVSST